MAEFLRENEALLTDKLLLPAMREDRGTFADYALDHEEEYLAQGWTQDDIRSAAAFVDGHVQEVLPWRVEQAAGAFRENLLCGLSNTTSAIYQRLRADGAAAPEELAAFVKKLETVANMQRSLKRSILRSR